MEIGGFNENSSYFIGILPDGTKRFYCEERDWKEEYAEMLKLMNKDTEEEGDLEMETLKKIEEVMADFDKQTIELAKDSETTKESFERLENLTLLKIRHILLAKDES